jgi:hypothetical protein
VRKLPLVGALLALAGCAQAATKAPPEVSPVKSEAHVTATAPAVEIAFAGRTPAKPPMGTILVDVTLRNAESSARWFVLPGQLPKDAEGEGVTGVEAWELSGSGRAVLGKWLGTAGFQTVLVAPGAEVKLQRVAIPVWKANDVKGPLAIEVVIAKDITVGGQPAAAWFEKTNPLSDSRASADVSKAKRAGSKMTEERDEVPVVFSEDRRITVEITVP